MRTASIFFIGRLLRVRTNAFNAEAAKPAEKNSFSELERQRHLGGARRMAVERLQDAGVVQLVRSRVPLCVRACIEDVEDIQRRFECPRPAKPEDPADVELQIFGGIVDDLSVAARWVRKAWQRRVPAESDGRRQGIRLRGAIGK